MKLSIFKKALVSGIMTAAIVAGSLIATLPAAAAHAMTVPLGAPGPLTADQARAVLRGLRPA